MRNTSMARLRDVRALILCLNIFYYFVETQANNYGKSNRWPFHQNNDDWQNNYNYGGESNREYNTRSGHLYNNYNSCDYDHRTRQQGYKECGPRRPHIVFIIADDLGWNDVSWNNEGFREVTPTLGKLAEEGVILDSYYTQPVCIPSRASIELGLYTFKTGFQTRPFGGTLIGIDPSFYTLPERLRNLGYSTNLVGKWGLGSCSQLFMPLKNGYNTFFGPIALAYRDFFTKKNGLSELDLRDNTGFSQDNTTYVEILFRQRVVEIIRNLPKDQSLFLEYTTMMPHSPLQVPPEDEFRFPLIEDNNRRIYAAMVSILDDSVKDIVGALKERGIWEDTLLVFVSDNGANRNFGGSNEPLRGGKGTFYEGGVQVPAFIHGNRIKRKGYRHQGLVHSADWLNTFLYLSEGTIDRTLDSLNVWDTISAGAPSPRTEIVHNIDRIGPPRSNRPLRSIRFGNYKLINRYPDALPYFNALAIANQNSDLSFEEILESFNITFVPPTEIMTELFNLADNPFEANNLALQETHIVIRLLKRIAEHEKDLVPSFFEVPSKFCAN